MSQELSLVRIVYIYGLVSPKKAIWKETFPMPNPYQPTKDDVNMYSFRNRFSNAVALPLAFTIAVMLNANPLASFLLRGLHIWVHEFGHATIAWLSGYKAIPLPFGWTNTSLEKSGIVYFGVLTLLMLLFGASYRERYLWPMAIAVILALTQFTMTWLLSINTYQMLMAFGGIGGEFYLSTLLLISFYFPLPNYWQWEFWRYPVAVGAAYTFWHAFDLWQHIHTGQEAIPWGTLWDGVGDANGDMNILSSQYAWTDGRIVNTYTTLGNVCFCCLIGIYAYFLIRQNYIFFYNSWQRFILHQT
ncbi:MAG: hypothetical protein AAGD25_40035 [Cyanobacteria bacterium P01_F01_bin.150]